MLGVDIYWLSHKRSPTPLSGRTETVAFGYRARALEQRSLKAGPKGPLAIRDTRRLTAGDGLAKQVTGEDFRSPFLNICSDCFASWELDPR